MPGQSKGGTNNPARAGRNGTRASRRKGRRRDEAHTDPRGHHSGDDVGGRRRDRCRRIGDIGRRCSARRGRVTSGRRPGGGRRHRGQRSRTGIRSGPRRESRGGDRHLPDPPGRTGGAELPRGRARTRGDRTAVRPTARCREPTGAGVPRPPRGRPSRLRRTAGADRRSKRRDSVHLQVRGQRPRGGPHARRGEGGRSRSGRRVDHPGSGTRAALRRRPAMGERRCAVERRR